MPEQGMIQQVGTKLQAWAETLSSGEQQVLAEWWGSMGGDDVKGFSADWWQAPGAWSNAWTSWWSNWSE